mgnify:CR=1 FL=1
MTDALNLETTMKFTRRQTLVLGAGTAAIGIVGCGGGVLATPKAAADDIARFTGGKTAKPTVASNGNSMKVTVPKGAQSGSFQIKVAGVTIDSGRVVLTIS